MRTILAALVSAFLAVLIALGIAHWSGWFDGKSRTVVIPEAVAPRAVATPVRAAKPVLGNEFDPSALYVARSPGVVTIYSEFGSSEAQGSGFVVTRTGLILTS